MKYIDPNFLFTEKSVRECVANGLASIYVYLGDDNMWKTKSTESRSHVKTVWAHVIYDSITFIVASALCIAGAFKMEHIDWKLLVSILISLHWLGLTLKAAFYIYLHPWVKLNDYNDTEGQSSNESCNSFGKTRLDLYKLLHGIMVATFPLAGLGCLIFASYQTSTGLGEFLKSKKSKYVCSI